MHVVIIENRYNKDKLYLYFQKSPTQQELRDAVVEVRGDRSHFLGLLDNSVHVVLADGEDVNYGFLSDHHGIVSGKLSVFRTAVRENQGYQS